VTPLELHVDIGEGLIALLPHRDEPVVANPTPEHDRNDDAENNPCRNGHGAQLQTRHSHTRSWRSQRKMPPRYCGAIAMFLIEIKSAPGKSGTLRLLTRTDV
jgi:hypothetical protein